MGRTTRSTTDTFKETFSKTTETQPSIPTDARKSHRSRNIAVGIIVVTLVVIMVVVFISNSTQRIQINGVNLQIQYGDYDQGVFGPVAQSITMSNQPNGILEVPPGQQFWCSLTLTESSIATSDDVINDITVTTPGFSIVSTTPALPISFSPGSSVKITVNLQSPKNSFNNPINLFLSTSGGTPPANQVQIHVQYSGSWSGAYGDTGGIQSWNGNGDYTLIMNRPNGATSWIVTANAQKQDSSSNPLTISILKMDGTVLKSSTTSTGYGMAQVAANVP